MTLARTPQVRPCRLADRRPGDQLLARVILRCAPVKFGAVVASLMLGTMVLGAPRVHAAAYTRIGDGVVVTPVGGVAKKVRLQVVAPTIIHVTAFPGDSLALPASLMAVRTGSAHVGFTVKSTAGAVTLSTGKVQAVV